MFYLIVCGTGAFPNIPNFFWLCGSSGWASVWYFPANPGTWKGVHYACVPGIYTQGETGSAEREASVRAEDVCVFGCRRRCLAQYTPRGRKQSDPRGSRICEGAVCETYKTHRRHLKWQIDTDLKRQIDRKSKYGNGDNRYTFFFPSLLISLQYSCAPLAAVTQIRGHMAGPPSPSPLRYVPSFSWRENFSFSSLIDSRRIVYMEMMRSI